MLDLFLFVAAAAQDAPVFIPRPDPPSGPMPADFRTLSQPHPNMAPERSFPDLTIKDLRIDGDTLYVMVANEGGKRAGGPISVTSLAEANGVRSEATPARIDKLAAGERRWVPLRQFSVKSAAIGGSAPLVALADASRVSVTISQPPAVPSALDRTGQRRERTDRDPDESNNSLTLAGDAIVRGRP